MNQYFNIQTQQIFKIPRTVNNADRTVTQS